MPSFSKREQSVFPIYSYQYQSDLLPSVLGLTYSQSDSRFDSLSCG